MIEFNEDQVTITELAAYRVWLGQVESLFQVQCEESVFDIDSELPLETLFKVGYFPTEVFDFWKRTTDSYEDDETTRGGYEF